ncbi:response regulator of the LytR/AlgR family [Lachnospiraceae bacterium KM106-2]|nr:response regulator of the LytR/AlgR family [Lachnospiraceae bacterium KM106-2]
MRIQIEVEESLQENEVIIRCNQITDDVIALQKAISQQSSSMNQIVFYKGETEYFVVLDDILFFETDETGICAHTKKELYQVKYKLYELEELLPGHFMRVSKSTILNINRIYSITRNLTGASLVEFQDTHKQVYVSRYYYKPLKCRLNEKRN